ncbi:MAG: hypothetical protein M1820_003521 [Bogoriella megaspora]|nr:MAG: hypothetical protein M1820_003521 [Bogoriella megaspora]
MSLGFDSRNPIAISIDNLFEDYTIQSAAEHNTINLEVPLAPLQRALKSALTAFSASIRLTKTKDNIPLLSLTITTASFAPAPFPSDTNTANYTENPDDESGFGTSGPQDTYRGTNNTGVDFSANTSRDTIITQEVPVRVLTAASVTGIHEPRCREPDVHILLPPLLQLKSVSDRFTKLAVAAKSGPPNASFSDSAISGRRGGGSRGATSGLGGSGTGPKLELLANMHGGLRLSLRTDAMSIASSWTDLTNPDLDPQQVEGAERGIANHPSTRLREMVPDEEGEEGWARVRIDGRDWGRVLSVGRLGGRVIACFCHELALILYVYLENEQDGGEDSVLTYYVQSYSA